MDREKDEMEVEVSLSKRLGSIFGMMFEVPVVPCVDVFAKVILSDLPYVMDDISFVRYLTFTKGIFRPQHLST